MQQNGSFKGAFVSNNPEYSGYGFYWVATTSRIETTGIIEPSQNNATVYPKQSSFHDPFYSISYSDQYVAPRNTVYKNNQKHVSTWLGFQRGAATCLGEQGSEGIPLHCLERVQNGALRYFKDNTVAFIISKGVGGASELQAMANERRIEIITPQQQEDLKALISGTFTFTFPKNWAGKIKGY